MRALAVIPGQADSLELIDTQEPPGGDGAVLVRTMAIDICGTDAEIASSKYGWAPPGRERLIIGHESIGRVLEAPAGSGFAADDLVVGIVRRPGRRAPCW